MTENRNRYPGINPHLNSFLQDVKGWRGFHTEHLTDLARALNAALPVGYYAAVEETFQITRQMEKNYVGADVLVYPGRASIPAPEAATVAVSEPTLVVPAADIDDLLDLEEATSIVVYHDETPVLRVELLSPANKPGGSHHFLYLHKRTETLHSGLRLLEMDYLHMTRPVTRRVPSYPDRQKGAYPYCIIVTDPRPTLEQGEMKVYGFGVLDPLPRIVAPLDGTDTVHVDFNHIYQTTFHSNPVFHTIRTDYTSVPANFKAYAPDDQALILQHMAAIVKDVPQ